MRATLTGRGGRHIRHTRVLTPLDVDDIDSAWDELHRTTPDGWFVGRPAYDERRDQWSMYAFDTRERPRVGRRAHEWTCVAPTQARVIRELARCLRELGAGRAPR